MIRQYLSRFMTGRYGMDQLNLFLTVTYLVLYLVFFLTGLWVLDMIVLVLLLVVLFRMLSRDIVRRQAENTRFLQIVRPIQHKFRTFRTRMKDREHRYFKCPSCGQQMRVPRGKGRISGPCPSWGAHFEEKS